MDPKSSLQQDGEHERPVRMPATAYKSITVRNATARKTGDREPPHRASDALAAPRTSAPLPRRVPATSALKATKQGSGRARSAGAKQPLVARDGGDNNVQRKVARKMASVEPFSQRRPQSTFDYIAAIPHGSSVMAKSTPTKPLYLTMQDKETLRTPRKKVDDDGFGSLNAPRISIGAMSVQRRPGVSPRKAEVPRSTLAGRQHAPATRQVEGVIPSSSESSDSDDESDIAPRVRLPKAARKTVPIPYSNVAKAARKRSSDTDSSVRSLGKAARKLNISSDIDDHSVIELSDEDEDIDQLLNAFDALTLGLTRLRRNRRLPYLRRNLRRGFEDRCARAGVPTGAAENPDSPIKVVYRYYPGGYQGDGTDSSSSEEECQEWVGTMTRWMCPLCPLYDPFNNRAMLAHHLSNDHGEVKVSWNQIQVRNTARWRITVVLPDYTRPKPEEATSDNSPLGSDTEQNVKLEGAGDEVAKNRSRSGSSSSSIKIFTPARPPLFLPESDEEEPPAPAVPQQEQVAQQIVEPTLLRRETETPEPLKPLSFSVETTQMPESRASTAAVVSYRGSLPARYPSPPPPEDPMGPAARYPYLPQSGNEAQTRYSCRIGGPRIYDLLNELSLEEFGIMSWAVVDREEELFEMDDVRDEDKVMLALWNRWMMLNKTRFIFDHYEKGVQAFLDQYWQLIHRAAGWRALRAFLLMLQVHKYLTIAGVVKMLKHYEQKTGMKLWYKDAEEVS